MVPLLAFVAPSLDVSSPNGTLVARLSLDGTGQPRLAVNRGGKPVLLSGRLGLDLATGGPLDRGLKVERSTRRSADSQWRPVAGNTKMVRNRYRELTLALREVRGGRRLELVVRAYDEGIAFRYRLPKGMRGYYVREELTEFVPANAPTATALVLPNERTPYEELYQRGPLKEGQLLGFPLMLHRQDGTAVAFTEADLTDFPGLYLRPKDGALRAHLSPRLDGSGLAAKKSGPFSTPWRVVMVGDPKRLLESNLVLNLNPPTVLKDTSWIRPGKTVFPWWNGYNTGDSGIEPGQTTEYHKWCIDFAARRGFPYHSIDGLDNIAWYGGRIVPYDGGPLTKGLPGLDLEEIVRYAKSKGVRIRLWMASAAAKAQMDVAYPYYEKLGIEGVMVDFFDRDDQETVNLVRRIVAKAAKHHLTITLHNLYKPTGLQRTYPNLLAFEAARNLEFDKWDDKGITPEHELDVAFVRGLAGPIDFHAGSFRNVLQKDFKPIDKAPMTIGTRARQLARYVVYFDPMNMVADSPAVYEASPAGLSFLAQVPTTWDETRVLAGEVGKYLVVARRKGKVWYVGGMTDSRSRTVKVPLPFLKGRYGLESWSDTSGAPTGLAITKGLAGKTLVLRMREAGGAVARLTPLSRSR
ncbi:glycoside hydrolase family 97 protein [bacterium]|nr:MAG: glycoside hydrolase family 97 protein [bacterium]